MSRLLRENWMIILVAALMAFGFVFLRMPGDDLASTARPLALPLASGRP